MKLQQNRKLQKPIVNTQGFPPKVSSTYYCGNYEGNGKNYHSRAKTRFKTLRKSYCIVYGSRIFDQKFRLQKTTKK